MANPNSIQPSVLFVLGTLWGDNGITSHLFTLAKGLLQQGWKVALASDLASGPEGAKEEAIGAIQRFESLGVQYFAIPFPELRVSSIYLLQTLKSLSTLNTAIGHFRPHVIHVHSLSVCPQIQLIRLRHRIPLVSTCHLEPDPNRLNVKLGGFFNAYLYNSVFGDRMVAVSSELKQVFARKMKVPPQNIKLIFHGIDHTRLRPPSLQERLAARKAMDLEPESKLICLIGRLAPVKGHNILLRALARLRSEGIEAIALCAGKGYGAEGDAIRAQAVQLGVSNSLRLLGFAETRQVLWASDVITLPSQRRSEAFGLVIPEAMLCGVVPVRTPAAGAFDQIEDGVNGFIVPFDDPGALASRLKQLLENDDLRAQMSAAALASARQKFTAERMVQDTIAVYNEVIPAVGTR